MILPWQRRKGSATDVNDEMSEERRVSHLFLQEFIASYKGFESGKEISIGDANKLFEDAKGHPQISRHQQHIADVTYLASPISVGDTNTYFHCIS